MRYPKVKPFRVFALSDARHNIHLIAETAPSTSGEGLQMNYDAVIEALLHTEHVEHFLLRQAQDAAEKHGDTETVQKIMEFRRGRRLAGTDLPRTLSRKGKKDKPGMGDDGYDPGSSVG